MQQRSQQIRQFFQSKVNPVFQPLIINLAKYRPEDILGFCIKWFKDKKIKCQSDSEGDEQNYPVIQEYQFNKLRKIKLQQSVRKKRFGVSSEVQGPLYKSYTNKRQEIMLKKGKKKPQKTHMRILFFISNSFLFRDFNQHQINQLIQNMNQKQVKQGQIIIKQGESGDCMYIVDQGNFQCYKEQPDQDQSNTIEKKILKTYAPGDTFGELLLLHNNKRQATIVCTKLGVLYSLSRQYFKSFKRMSIIKKKIQYLETLKKVKLFDNLDNNQYQKICDVLTEVSFQAGKLVIIEGDIGNKFYIILEGILVALKGTDQKIIQCYKQGDYFGELALLNDIPRQASVKSLTKCTLVYLSQNVFKRIISRYSVQCPLDDKYRRKRVLIHRRNQF